MNTKQNIPNLKFSLKLGGSLLLLGLILGALITYGQTPSSIFYISEGIYPGAPSYTVWTDGITYYAKDSNGLLSTNTNATTLIQNCISDYGYTVYIEEGTYPITQLTLNASIGYRHIYGAGIGLTVLQGSTSAALIYIYDTDWITLNDFTLDGVTKTSNGITIDGDYTTYNNNYLTLRNIEIKNCFTGLAINSAFESSFTDIRCRSCTNGITITNSLNSYFNNIYVSTSTVYGLYIYYNVIQPEGLAFKNCIFYNSYYNLEIEAGNQISFDNVFFDFSTSNNPVRILGGQFITFSQCYFSDSTNSTGRGASLSPYARELLTVTFSLCTFSANKYAGIYLYNDTSSKRAPTNINIDYCVFSNNGITETGQDILISGGNITRITNTLFYSSAVAYSLAGVSTPLNVIISNNVFNDAVTISGNYTSYKNIGFADHA